MLLYYIKLKLKRSVCPHDIAAQIFFMNKSIYKIKYNYKTFIKMILIIFSLIFKYKSYTFI